MRIQDEPLSEAELAAGQRIVLLTDAGDFTMAADFDGTEFLARWVAAVKCSAYAVRLGDRPPKSFEQPVTAWPGDQINVLYRVR